MFLLNNNPYHYLPLLDVCETGQYQLLWVFTTNIDDKVPKAMKEGILFSARLDRGLKVYIKVRKQICIRWLSFGSKLSNLTFSSTEKLERWQRWFHGKVFNFFKHHWLISAELQILLLSLYCQFRCCLHL